MAILSGDELRIYAPDLDSSGASFDAESACVLAQRLIEAYLGRELEQQSVTEVRSLSSVALQAVQLRYWPIATSPAPVISVRSGNYRNRYHRPVGLSIWEVITSSNYILDPSGLLSLNVQSVSGWQPSTIRATEIKAVYTTGIDTTVVSNDLIALKAAIAAVVRYQQSPTFQTGVTAVNIPDQISVSYGGGSNNRNGNSNASQSETGVPQALLLPFEKYRPRGLL